MALPLAGLFVALGPWITRFFMAKAALMFAGFLGRVGLVLATNELVMQPLIDSVIARWQTIPAGLQCWLSLVGVTQAAGVILTGVSLLSAKRVFFAKS